MSSITDPQSDAPSDAPSEELVAYLDGELSPEECRRVEERLAQDADYRQQLRDLDQAWEALDVLPAATVDDHFAHTTIEMVTVAAKDDLSQHAAQTAAANRKGFLFWAVGGLAVAVAAFAFTRTFLPDENDRLLTDLPVIRQFDHLSQIENVEFLRKLPTAVPLENLAQDVTAVAGEVAAVTAAAAPTLAERRRWVEGLLPEEKASLASQARRFADLAEKNSDEEKRLRDMEREIRQDENADELRKTMVVYSRWLAQRPPGDQEDLRVLSADKRLETIAAIVRYEGEQAARVLSAQDAAELREEIFEIYEDRKRDFHRDMDKRDRDLRVRLEGSPRRRALIVLSWALRNDDTDDSTRDRLTGQLSPEAQDYWERVSRRGRLRKQHQLWQWVRQAMQPRWDSGELEKFFTSDKLDSAQREQLLSLPPDEMQARLERLYVSSELGLRDIDDWLPELGGGEPFPQPPPGRDRPDGRRGDGPRGPRDGDRPDERRPPRRGPP